MEYIERVAVDE